MITADISNIWGGVSLPDLLSLEGEISAAHALLTDPEGPYRDACGWLAPSQTPESLQRIQSAAERIRSENDILVVIASGELAAGPRAAISLLQGPYRNLCRGEKAPVILFAGDEFSSRGYEALTKLLEGKDFSLCLMQNPGDTPETGVLFRNLHWLLERKYGTDETRRRIYAVLGDVPLAQTAREEDWELFSLPKWAMGGYSLFSAAGLLPMAAAGMDIAGLLQGAREGGEAFALRSFENPVWLYAAVRNLLSRRGRGTEVFAAFESGFSEFGLWWQQLFSRAEGQGDQGIIPVPVSYPAGISCLGQQIRQSERVFETLLRFSPGEDAPLIFPDIKNSDRLNYLSHQPLSLLTDSALAGLLTCHPDCGVPVISIDCGPVNSRALGELFYFFQLGSALSACVQGADPFSPDGAEPYRQTLYRLLGRPEGET